MTPEPPRKVPVASKGPDLAASVKMVVWDLDDTLWSGTLEEGGVEIDDLSVELIRVLNRRGIVNAICSKNDLATVKEKLLELGLWDEFVFPSINWDAKGPRLRNLITDAQLRPENVLFIDDVELNRRDAEHFSPGLQTAGPEIIPHLLSLDALRGKDDRNLSRLRQYRILEQKLIDRGSSAGTNEDFLRECEIRVELHDDCLAHVDRLLELINRSNQLNYAKRRFEKAELLALLSQDDCTTRYVRVHDRYGDYGICGFYALQEDRLTDFVFSCRIMNMGIERWLYAHLGKPQITIVPDVATPLDAGAIPDWVELSTSKGLARAERSSRSNRSVLLKGGCDLSAVADFLGGSIETEFTRMGWSGSLIHTEHTEILRRSNPATLQAYGATIDRLPFLDRAAYSSLVLDSSYDVLVYSVLMDYTQGLYRLRDTDFVVPYGLAGRDVTDSRWWPSLIESYGRVGIDDSFLRWFSDNFEFEGELSSERFAQNVIWLANVLPKEAKIVFINGAEVPLEHPIEGDRSPHHRSMNAALEDAVSRLPNASICDVRSIVTSAADVTDNIRHYQRRGYAQIANAIRSETGTRRRIAPKGTFALPVQRLHRLRARLHAQRAT